MHDKATRACNHWTLFRRSCLCYCYRLEQLILAIEVCLSGSRNSNIFSLYGGKSKGLKNYLLLFFWLLEIRLDRCQNKITSTSMYCFKNLFIYHLRVQNIDPSLKGKRCYISLLQYECSQKRLVIKHIANGNSGLNQRSRKTI